MRRCRAKSSHDQQVKSCLSTSRALHGCVPVMELDDLIDQLCVMAGIIMEDASVGAVSNGDDRGARVTALVRASETIASLVKAASALLRES